MSTCEVGGKLVTPLEWFSRARWVAAATGTGPSTPRNSLRYDAEREGHEGTGDGKGEGREEG